MAEKQTLNIDIVVNDGKAKQSLDKVTKSTGDLNKESQQSLDNFGAFGLTLGGVKTAFGKIIPTAKVVVFIIKSWIDFNRNWCICCHHWFTCFILYKHTKRCRTFATRSCRNGCIC